MSDNEKNNLTTEPVAEHPVDAAPLDAAKGAEVMEKFEKESRTRNFEKPWLKKVIYFLCLAFTLYHLAYASGIRQGPEIENLLSVEREAFHIGGGRDPGELREHAVDTFHPDQSVLHPCRYVHLCRDAGAITGHGDGVQVELTVGTDRIILEPRYVLKRVLDLKPQLIPAFDRYRKDHRLPLSVIKLEHLTYRHEKGRIN